MSQQETPAAEVQTSLMPKLTKVEKPVETKAVEPEWYLMEGMAGQGARPEFLDGRYKSLADQAKAYKELEKKLGVAAKVPEKYDLDKFKEHINGEDPKINALLSFAREKHLGQDVVDGVLGAFVEHLGSSKVDYAKEIEKLGKDGRVKIEQVKNWAENNFSEATLETIGRIGQTADVIQMLDEFRQLQFHNQTRPPVNSDAPGLMFTPMTVKEIEDEMKQNSKRYVEDSKYRAEIKQKFRQALGED